MLFRCLMLKNMAEGLGSLVSDVSVCYRGFDNFLTPNSASSHNYISLKNRPTCDSLEEKQEKAENKNKAVSS